MVLAVTGGGSGALSALLGVAGASRSVLAAFVPYAPQALTEWLGSQPDEFCSSWTARAMAMRAYLLARHYQPTAETAGISCTASLATDRPKRGAHRLHLAWQDAARTASLSLELAKGQRTRREEEALATALLLNVVAEGCGMEERLEIPLVAPERIEARRVVAPKEQQNLLAGRVKAVPSGSAAGGTPSIVLPGAFRPLHRGHCRMAQLAGQLLGGKTAYELSIANVDKPPLDYLEIEERSRQFSPSETLWLTQAPTFLEKSAVFPGATFVVGADTIARIGQPRYYGGREQMDQAIRAIAAAGCRFLVFGRQYESRFCLLDDLALPSQLARLCQQVPPDLFRDDISSTELRKQSRAE